jgi:DNA-directed RNA polymerase subunit RPC12/RpoP
MDASEIPEVPATIRCDVCGAQALVVSQTTRRGQQLVIMKTEDSLYVPIDCPQCGRRMQALDSNEA